MSETARENHRMKLVGALSFATLAATFFMLIAPRPASVSSREPAASKHLPDVSQWSLIGVFPLSMVPTGHPQGLNVTDDELTLSSQGSDYGFLQIYSLTRSENKVIEVKPKRTLTFTGYPGLTHAGGLGRSRDRQTIYVPVAAKPFGKAVVLEVGRQGQGREIAWFPFHIGTLIADPQKPLLHAIGFDEGAHFELYGNSVYTVDLSTGERLSAFHPTTGESFQDCKPLTMTGLALCTNKAGSNLLNLRGSLDLVHFHDDGSYNVVHSIEVPHVNLDGSFSFEWGPYIAGLIGAPPLTYNAFDFEVSSDQKSLVLYFVPNDYPDSRLYVYRVNL